MDGQWEKKVELYFWRRVRDVPVGTNELLGVATA